MTIDMPTSVRPMVGTLYSCDEQYAYFCQVGESEDHTNEEACKGSTLALKPRPDVTRSSSGSRGGAKGAMAPPVPAKDYLLYTSWHFLVKNPLDQLNNEF